MINREAIQDTMALVLAGGRGSRLKELTQTRAKPAVYFGGKFRIIDFALSNCVNSGIRRIGVVTQYKSHSLLKHLQAGWSFMRNEMNEFIDMMPAQQRLDEVHWYRGTSDAVYQNLDIIREYHPKYILILSGDHIYRMDYSVMLEEHLAGDSPVTIGCVEVDRDEATKFGVMRIDETGLIKDFVEKPNSPAEIPGKPGRCMASMGIYLFNADFLYQVLEEDQKDASSSRDFGRDVIPKMVKLGLARAHSFEKSCVRNAAKTQNCYWRDVGTIDSFWAANLDLASVMPDLDIYDRRWPIWTNQLQLPPAKFVQDIDGKYGVVRNSIISGGCVISGSDVYNSVIFPQVRIHSKCSLEGVVAFPQAVFHQRCEVRNAIVDKHCVLPPGFRVGCDSEWDKANVPVSKGGIVIVTNEAMKSLKERRPDLFEAIPLKQNPNRPK